MTDDTRSSCESWDRVLPPEAASSDPEVLRAALLREVGERRRLECTSTMQMDIVKLALDLLVREPDAEGFFGGLARTVVEESESHTCAFWLVDEREQTCSMWLAYVKDRLFTPPKGMQPSCAAANGQTVFPCEAMAAHLYAYTPGWSGTVEYSGVDDRLPDAIRQFGGHVGWSSVVATPLVVGTQTLGWMTVCSAQHSEEPDYQWWRRLLVEATARQAALALHHSRLIEQHRAEERRKGILEERNRLARDIHDNLAQGFAAILMQLQAVRRDGTPLPPKAAASIDTALELARTHLTEARRSVGALRPNVGSDEDVASALKRLAALSQRTTSVPIDLVIEELPRFGDGVEREILAIAQEALNNAVRHARARRISIRASAVKSVGLRLSVVDDGRGMPREVSPTGFGMTSMKERAERIGASLTIVTAPRNGTEVVLAWDPAQLPTQVHVVA